MAEPVVLRRYVLPSIKGEGWAVFVIGSDGYFSGVTDYGNVAYWWAHHGCKDFREFLLTAAVEWDYFIRKLFPNTWEVYDGDATLKEVKAFILKFRREKRITHNEAREAWYELMEEFEGLEHEWLFIHWIMNANSVVRRFDDLHELRCNRPDCHAKAFVTQAMARLAEVLRKELEEERAQQATGDARVSD